MKHFFFALLTAFSFIGIASAQNDLKLTNQQIFLDSFYENRHELLIKSMIINVDSISRKELIQRLKNWGGVNFVNLKEVLVSETESQLVFNYIDKGLYYKFLGMVSTSNWYIRLVIQVKDGKLRLLFYDDGNAFWPGDGKYVSSTMPRVYKLSNYFQEDENGLLVAQKRMANGLLNLKNNIEKTADSIRLGVNNPVENIKTDDW
jgi:hypothetical protein